jgi:hypothetical protein
MFESQSEYVDILALLSTESTAEEWSCLGSLLWDVGLLRGVEPTCRLIVDTARRLSKSSQAMRERLQQVKKALLRRAQVTLADIIAKEEELAQRDPQPAPVGSANHARGAMTFVSYLFIYGMIPSKFLFIVGEQLLDIGTDLTTMMLSVLLTTDKFMVLHDTAEWSQYHKFERLLDRVQDLADDETLSPVSRKALHSILKCREQASLEQYLAEGIYSDSEEESDYEDDEAKGNSALLFRHGIDEEIENKDPSRFDVLKSSSKID